ncbi:TPA: hypothetical protein U1391_001890 [Streptococcus suis]|uniref:Uncharacterized protein n=3 Tax=Streptococcus TaxID=1301 RepID=A0A0Z8D0S6_STRSU|nr:MULTISPECIES: hypothetical protein [Streptococcus]MCK4028588.1 hypothetical protein [Streptococcus suis]MDW8767354.1 hypothetical protein [Streptococcus suis]NQH39768.1 hypothetical protein [Streptococcus suis]NQH86653.1 hypothetical protein [Streptococcus suis]NQN17086.1 hypothetical protein [Streptococcus suis]
MKKRKKIPNVSKPNGSRIPTAELPKSNVTFDFQYKNWLQSFKKGEFTTFLKDSDEYADFITQILTELIPKITKDWEPGKQGFKHCHTIPMEDDAYQLYSSAIKRLHNLHTEQLTLWQFGLSQGCRLICYLQGKTIYPLLIDYHHLGYPSLYYNQKDFKNYNYCPMTKNKI